MHLHKKYILFNKSKLIPAKKTGPISETQRKTKPPVNK